MVRLSKSSSKSAHFVLCQAPSWTRVAPSMISFDAFVGLNNNSQVFQFHSWSDGLGGAAPLCCAKLQDWSEVRKTRSFYRSLLRTYGTLAKLSFCTRKSFCLCWDCMEQRRWYAYNIARRNAALCTENRSSTVDKQRKQRKKKNKTYGKCNRRFHSHLAKQRMILMAGLGWHIVQPCVCGNILHLKNAYLDQWQMFHAEHNHELWTYGKKIDQSISSLMEGVVATLQQNNRLYRFPHLLWLCWDMQYTHVHDGQEAKRVFLIAWKFC